MQGEVKKAEAKVSGSQDTDFVIRHLADNEHSAEMVFHEIQLQVVLFATVLLPAGWEAVP